MKTTTNTNLANGHYEGEWTGDTVTLRTGEKLTTANALRGWHKVVVRVRNGMATIQTV
jgi:hypothetical protein